MCSKTCEICGAELNSEEEVLSGRCLQHLHLESLKEGELEALKMKIREIPGKLRDDSWWSDIADAAASESPGFDFLESVAYLDQILEEIGQRLKEDVADTTKFATAMETCLKGLERLSLITRGAPMALHVSLDRLECAFSNIRETLTEPLDPATKAARILLYCEAGRANAKEILKSEQSEQSEQSERVVKSEE